MRENYSNTRCFIPVISLLLFVAVIAVFNTSPNRSIPWLHSNSGRKRGEACDIFRGEWVPDPDAPYYTNDTCSVIDEHYDCLTYGRPDLGFIKWRWRPDGCDLPRLDPARFLAVMRGKSMAFVGDSVARNHMHSLICLLTRVAEPEPSKPSDKHMVFYYGEHNFTVNFFWAPFLVRYEQTDEDGPWHTGLWNLYLDEPDAVWAAHVAALDYVVVSASTWFYRPAMLYEAGRRVGCQYCDLPNVTDLTLQYALRMATRAALRALDGADGRFRGTAVLRTVTPSQYENGEWNKGGDCVRTRPSRRGEKEIQGTELDFHTMQVEELAAAKEAAKATGGTVKMILMDTTDAMILRADAHPSKYRGYYKAEENIHKFNDCVHWCLPGAIDTWNDMLLHMLTH
ncbi:hypothetical protein EJB05_45272, partial [Eragrostis curvula]